MELDEVKDVVGDLPSMTLEQGRRISAFIRQHDLRNILELGFRHGVSTCYMAATVDSMGGGKITTIDLEGARNNSPAVAALLQRLGLMDYVEVHYEPTSYLWRLMKFLESDPLPQFDFCYLDGAHSWFVDGFAFLLVDRLLREGGWIILDDMDWTYSSSFALKDKDFVRNMPPEERDTPQVRKIYELLVKQHPGYGDFMTAEGWGYAHKLSSTPNISRATVIREVVVETREIGLGAFLNKAYRKLRA